MTVNVDEFLTKKVSYQEKVWSLPSDKPLVRQVLCDIRDGRYAEQIGLLRDLISREERDQYCVDKKNLPSVTFSGTFNRKRQIEELIKYNDLLVLDVDHLSKDMVKAASKTLREDAHVLSCWLSPSEEGLKGLVALTFSEELRKLDIVVRHRAAFVLVSDYFKEAHDISLDKSGSDITRLCFLSSDPDLHLQTNVVPFKISEIPESMQRQRCRSAGSPPRSGSIGSDKIRRHLLHRTEGKNKPNDRFVMKSIIKYLTKRELRITINRDRWIRVGYAIATSFTYDVGKEYYLRLCRLDGDDHDEDGSIRLLESCYYDNRGMITMGTILHYAQESGYRYRGDRDQY